MGPQAERLTRRSLLAAMAFGAWALGAGGVDRAQAGAAVNAGKLDGVAIKGYDTVAYFTDGRPIKGSPDISYRWLGESWYFASAEHRSLFAGNPIRYAPQFGGFCALGISKGHVDPEVRPDIAWRILDGKLYLFSMPFEEEWTADPSGVVASADANWPSIETGLAAQ